MLSESKKTESLTRMSGLATRESVGPLLVVREFQHRIANTLTVLNASLQLQFAAFSDPKLHEALRRHQEHILAVAELHRFFGAAPGTGNIAVEPYFQELCAILSRSVLAPLGLNCEAYVSSGVLPAEKCEWLGLVVAELAMNAAKHAFPGDVGGCVRIEMHPRDAYWCCTVIDSGVGIRNVGPGGGSKITNSLVGALGGRLATRSGSNGTAITIVFPR